MSVPQYYPQPKSKTGRNILLIIAGILLAVACGVGAFVAFAGGTVATVNAVDAQMSADAVDRAAHVKITACKTTEFETGEVRYTITNASDQPQTYLLEFDIHRGDERVGTAAGIEEDVAPGATVKGAAYGTATDRGKARCTLRSA